MSGQAPITISQDFEIVSPEARKAYVVLIDEWDYLKNKIGQIKDNANIYHTAGSILLGAAGSALITALTTDYKKTVDGTAPTSQVIAWALVATFTICGILALFFGRSQRNVENVMVQDVVQQMELMEQKYKASGVSTTAQAQEGNVT